jgi:uncharacterized protein with GYD domain
MPKYLGKASYSAEGARGLVKEGGTKRRAAIQKLAETVGGKIESFYFAYGQDDAFVLIDLPNASTAVALSLAVNGSGAVTLSLVPLITPEEMDAACKIAVAYKPPGS